MADEFKIVASLNIPESASRINKDIPKLEGQAKHLKIVADLNPTLSIKNIQNTLNKLQNNAKITVGVDIAGTNGKNGQPVIKPILDRSAYKDIDSYINAISAKLSQSKIGDISSITKGIKESLGANSPEVKSAVAELVNALKLTPNNQKAIADSYSNLIESIRGTISSSKIVGDVNFEKNLADEIYRISTSYANVQTQAQQTSNVVANANANIGNSARTISTQYRTEFGVVADVVKQAETEFSRFGEASAVSNKSVKALDGVPEHFRDFTIQVKSATGEVQKFFYTFENVGDNKNPVFKYMLQNINEADAGVKKLIESQQKAQDKGKALRTSLTADLKSIRSAWEDVNGGKSVKSDENIERLKQQYVKVTQAIRELRNADDTTLASMKANADAQIDKLNQMVTQYHNAEKVATQLRAKGFETVKIDTGNNIDKFINSINNSKVPIQAMQTEINKLTSDFAQLDTIQDQAGKSAALTNILNTLDNAKTKFQSLKVMYQSIGNYDKQLDKLAQDWQKQGIYIGNVKTTIESLKASLANVTTANGLTNWVNDFKTQIGAINEMPIKVMECKQKIAETSKEWYKQGILVKDVAQEMSAFKQSLSLVSSSGEMEQWNKNWDSFIQRVAQAKGNLDKQVESYNNIYSIQAKIAKLNPTKDTAEITRLNEKLKLEQDSLSKLQQQSNIYTTLISQEQQEQYITEQTAQTRDKLLSATNTGVKQYQTTITNAISKLQGIANSAVFKNNASNPQVTQTKQDINSLITAYQNLATKLQGNITPAGLETVRTELTQLNARFNDATTTAKRFETELRSDNGADQLAQKVALLTQRIKAYRQANSKSEKMFGSQYDSMLSQLANPNIDLNTYNAINKQFQVMRQKINAANVAGKNLWQTLKEKVAKFTGWMSMTYAISLVTRTIRSMVTDVVELDTALIDLKKTFKGTNEDLKEFYRSSNDIAKQLGVTTKEVITQASAWSRLGYNTKSQIESLSQTSSIFAAISPEMDVDTATNTLVSVLKAYEKYGLKAEDALDGIASKVNAVGNNFAVSNSDIAEALQRSSASMASANTDLEHTIALITAGKFRCLYVQKCA